jgi:hypothetical protein
MVAFSHLWYVFPRAKPYRGIKRRLDWEDAGRKVSITTITDDMHNHRVTYFPRHP